MASGQDRTEQVFREAYEKGLRVVSHGKPADYIPELKKADPESFGICMLRPDGTGLSFGDADVRFTMQSISKIVSLAVCLNLRGFEDTFSYVQMEPSGDPFNSMRRLDTAGDTPFNPMINAGAIQVVSLLADTYSFEDMLDFTRRFCMDDGITLNESVYRSEAQTGFRNRAIAYLLRGKEILQADPDKTLELYFKLCSMNVTARSLAGLGLVISCGGVDPFTGERLINDATYVRVIKSLMFTCGLYDGSGEYGVRVGIPSKSGVGGGIMCAAKGPMGIGLYGPALNEQGNSVAGMKAIEYISKGLDLHVLD